MSHLTPADVLTQQGPLSLGYPSVYSFRARGKEYTISRVTGWSFGDHGTRVPVFKASGGERFITLRDSEEVTVLSWIGGTFENPVFWLAEVEEAA